MDLNHTHNPSATSWVASANTGTTDFPIQNLPFAVFRRQGPQAAFRGGVAIGDQVVDLDALARSGVFQGAVAQALSAAAQPQLNGLLALGPVAWSGLRHALFDALIAGAAGPATDAVRQALVPQNAVAYS